ncbi:hypothetical protein [Sphingomonas alpina]|uniref:Uncharacterized protein n=1 Tax=Sphingomonas alpina TaxID=653931 RepID=A0A7H0LPE4_9SPHN|nr:hypothetical protein [Sphingomonas alpina]QNQ11547.1 hypothetical protein H3Z74_10670 [Sphingomonas alpina]
MLAGLIFATEDADDRRGTLAATLPFGGLTLIEFQARLVVAAGASQLIVVVARLTPELLGAISRIGRRGVSVDVVRNAVEAKQKIHPLARVLVVADGLVTTGDVVALLAGDGEDAILTMSDRDAVPGFERVGVDAAWAGLARLDPKRIAEVAAMPRDYDFQSTLLRVAAQAQAVQIAMPPGAAGGAHGIERDSRTLADRGNVILAALVSKPVAWADRFLLAPLARLVLPALMARGMPTWALGATGCVIGLGGLAAIWFAWPGTGVALTIVAALAFTIGQALAWLRDEEGLSRAQRTAIPGFAALAALELGHASMQTGTATGWTLSITLIAAAALVERAAHDRTRRAWWATSVAYLVAMLIPVGAGYPLIGLSLAAMYAGVTLFAAIEAFREKP